MDQKAKFDELIKVEGAKSIKIEGYAYLYVTIKGEVVSLCEIDKCKTLMPRIGLIANKKDINNKSAVSSSAYQMALKILNGGV